MRTGVLSDAHTMKACAPYRPIPLGQVATILSTDAPKPNNEFQFRASKYTQPPPRPSTFMAMSNSMAKHSDPTNPMPFMERLITTYDGELKEPVPSEQLMTLQPLFEDIGEEAGDESPPPQEELEENLGDLSEEEAKLFSPNRETRRQRGGPSRADLEARSEALIDPEIAARALFSPSKKVLRDRAVDQPVARV
jgi:hypothetical protein